MLNAFVSRHLWMRSDDVGGGLLLLADRFDRLTMSFNCGTERDSWIDLTIVI
jgi:hypothetical protein